MEDTNLTLPKPTIPHVIFYSDSTEFNNFKTQGEIVTFLNKIYAKRFCNIQTFNAFKNKVLHTDFYKISKDVHNECK